MFMYTAHTQDSTQSIHSNAITVLRASPILSSSSENDQNENENDKEKLDPNTNSRLDILENKLTEIESLLNMKLDSNENEVQTTLDPSGEANILTPYNPYEKSLSFFVISLSIALFPEKEKGISP